MTTTVIKADDFIYIEELNKLFEIFVKNGDELRLVGGCIRNFLLGKEINDYDLCSIYTPDEIVEILNKNSIKYLTIGKNFGTITAIINNKHFEITTLREEYDNDGRYTKTKYIKDYSKDAERRDFTINALYMDKNKNIYDYFSGLTDLKIGFIRFIGNAKARIEEDYLRILRFFRFFAYCGVFYDYNALLECKKQAKNLEKLSSERITAEFSKILMSNFCCKTLKIMDNNDILKYILYNKNKMNFDNLQIFLSIKNFINFQYDFIFILALISNNNKISLSRLSLTNKQKKHFESLKENKLNDISDFEIKKSFFLLNDRQLLKELLLICCCCNFSNFSIIQERLNFIDNLNNFDFKITGNDLMSVGFSDKKQFSKLITKANEMYINSHFDLSKEEILKKI